MNEVPDHLLRIWSGRFRFPELVVLMAESSPDPAAVRDAVLAGIVSALDETGVVRSLTDEGRFQAAASAIDHCPALSADQVTALRGHNEDRKLAVRQDLEQRVDRLRRDVERADIEVPIDAEVLLERAGSDWPAVLDDLTVLAKKIEKRMKARQADLLAEIRGTADVGILEELVRTGELRTARHLLSSDHVPGGTPPSSVPPLPVLPPHDPEDMLRWHLDPDLPAPPEFVRITQEGQRLLRAFSDLGDGDESAVDAFIGVLGKFLGGRETARPRRLKDGYLSRIMEAFSDPRLPAGLVAPMLEVYVCPGRDVDRPEEDRIGRHLIVGRSLSVDELVGRRRGALLDLRGLLRLVHCDKDREVQLLRLLGPQWTLADLGIDGPHRLDETLAGTSWSTLCWIVDLAGLGGEKTAATLSFESGDDPVLLYTLLEYITEHGLHRMTSTRLDALRRWREDGQLSMRMEKSVLGPVEGAPTAVLALWAALASVPVGEEFGIEELSMTVELCGGGIPTERLEQGLRELGRQPSLAAAAGPTRLRLRRSGALFGLAVQAEARLVKLLQAPPGSEPLSTAEPVPSPSGGAWTAFRYALGPVWPASLDGDLLTGCDLVEVVGELRAALENTRPDLEVLLDVPARAPSPVGVPAAQALLYELLANAAEAVGFQGRIEVAARVEGNEVILQISDNGPGIAPEIRQEHQVFKAGVSTRSESRGQGLAVVRRLVRLFDGEVSARRHGSHPLLTGARFEVVLPGLE